MCYLVLVDQLQWCQFLFELRFCSFDEIPGGLKFDFDALAKFRLQILLSKMKDVNKQCRGVRGFKYPPMHFIRPLTMMASELQSAEVSSIECEVSNTAAPAFCAPEMTDHNCRRAPGSRPQEGSSITNTGGKPVNATPTESLRFVPPEYPSTRLSPNDSIPTRASKFSTMSFIDPSGTPLSRAYITNVSLPVNWLSNASN